MISRKPLATYLNDHLSGSTLAIDMLTHIAAAAEAPPMVKQVCREILQEVNEDRLSLEQLMIRLGISQSTPRKAAAWLGEKFAQLKLVIDDPARKALYLLEATEAVSLGIEGKRLLWQLLLAASELEPSLDGPDYPTLIRRAESQLQRMELARLAAGRDLVGANLSASRAVVEG